LRHDRLSQEITEGRMRGKPTRERKRTQMLHDLANDGDFVALMGSQGQTGMDTQKKNVKKRSIPEDY